MEVFFCSRRVANSAPLFNWVFRSLWLSVCCSFCVFSPFTCVCCVCFKKMHERKRGVFKFALCAFPRHFSSPLFIGVTRKIFVEGIDCFHGSTLSDPQGCWNFWGSLRTPTGRATNRNTDRFHLSTACDLQTRDLFDCRLTAICLEKWQLHFIIILQLLWHTRRYFVTTSKVLISPYFRLYRVSISRK